MPTEQQTSYDAQWGMYGGYYVRRGQRLTISNREVSKLSFNIGKNGSPPGNVTFAIRKVSDDSIIVSKAMVAVDLPLSTAEEWVELTFDTPTTINEEVRITCEYDGGDGNNAVLNRYQSSNVKDDEEATWYLSSWTDAGTASDCAYKYTYTGVAAAVTTLNMSAIQPATATGNGNITSLGDPTPTQHGHCWNTTGTPTTSDSKTTNGVPTLGLFTSSLTDLTEGTLYYVRAYVTNQYGTSYGNQISFVAVAGEGGGVIAVVESRLHYVDAYGNERYIEGIAV